MRDIYNGIIMKSEKQPSKRKGENTQKAEITDLFTSICKSDLHVECVKEYRFHPVRRWRFDYAIPDKKIAIEIDGGVWNYGRHNRASGYVADMEKFNAAASMGWVVLKFTPQQQYTRGAFDLIAKTIKQVDDGD